METYDIDAIIASYLRDHGGWPDIRRAKPQKWDEGLLHITDLTACPRAVAMRLRGDTTEGPTPGEERMFWGANMMHELVYHALEYHGLLERCEVPIKLPDGWSGTADMLLPVYLTGGEGRHVADVKTSHPNILRYGSTLPKVEHVWQVSAYSHFLGIDDDAEILYFPLGGSGASITKRVRLIPGEQVEERMRELEAVREMLPDLPGVLGSVIEHRGVRRHERLDGTVTYTADIVQRHSDWRCSYCRFACPGRGRGGSSLLARISVGPDGIEVKPTQLGKMMMDEVQDFIAQDIDTIIGGNDDNTIGGDGYVG